MEKPTQQEQARAKSSSDSLATRFVSSVIGFALLLFIMWVGLPLILPVLIGILWLATAELRDMLRLRGIELNMQFLRWGGVVMLLFSLPQLHHIYPGIPWREVALGLVLIGAFSYELLYGANIPRFAFSLMTFLYVPFMLGYLVLLRYTPDAVQGFWTLLLPLFASFSTDVGAYFVGKYFGKRKLAPSISPGKTVEGSIGGMVAGFLGVLLIAALANAAVPFRWVELLAVSLLLSLSAQLGDLTESMLKRYCGVKDSGAFLPGHGGLLDRMDSLLFSVPLTYFLLRIFVG
ncbi:Phosphatidate cytidylyltransferase [Calidithermus terrae]|uniref:Phosphatidate cytidylyltransferase n=1 Tax=Calidithermus terrae TaxID=1408545 RepID=A0A399ES29_9DEIN|nr:phosphatidate cytidylyltransferase [Calidithermus terrae]RIH86313.1 Phosphatidate cytidylyltransferase [Calidithermus terrae]